MTLSKTVKWEQRSFFSKCPKRPRPGLYRPTSLIDTIIAVRETGISEEQLAPVLEFQRKAQWLLDFIAAENSMGFHAPQEAARILGEAADLARQGQVTALSLR